MNLKDIKILCEHRETKNVELKTSTSLLRSAFETICAFLNSDGGTVLIGVRDDGSIIGQHVSDGTRRDIAKEIKRIEPTAYINVEYIDVGKNKFVIVLHVEVGEHAPYIYDGRPFQRDESETNRMSQHRYEQLLVRRSQLNHSWEEFISEDYDINSLDHEEIYSTVMDGISEKRIPASIARESVERILRQLDLIINNKIKRAAVILFGKEIKTGYTQCWLKMARFKGIDDTGDFIDNQQVYCNAFKMLVEADNFFRKHLPIASYFKPNQFKRIDKPILPVLALREALVNAICHRDYADYSGYISIAIFDDRVEIWNNGTLTNKLKLEDLKRKHDSVLRNKLIAKVFYFRGYIEAWGTGTTKMINLCKKYAIPSPNFSERTGGFVVTFKFAEPIGGYKEQKKIELTSRQREILKLLKISSLNSAQLTENLKNSPSRRMIQIDLTKLEKAKLIRREGESRSIIWKVNFEKESDNSFD